MLRTWLGGWPSEGGGKVGACGGVSWPSGNGGLNADHVPKKTNFYFFDFLFFEVFKFVGFEKIKKSFFNFIFSDLFFNFLSFLDLIFLTRDLFKS